MIDRQRRVAQPPAYPRLRIDRIAVAGSHEPDVQKALVRMDLKLDDLNLGRTGISGLKPVRAGRQS